MRVGEAGAVRLRRRARTGGHVTGGHIRVRVCSESARSDRCTRSATQQSCGTPPRPTQALGWRGSHGVPVGRHCVQVPPPVGSLLGEHRRRFFAARQDP